MSEELPPNVQIFNGINYNSKFFNDGNNVTVEYVNTNFLKYPTAQGEENLAKTNVSGLLTANAGIVW
jgi:hypothetical protein